MPPGECGEVEQRAEAAPPPPAVTGAQPQSAGCTYALPFSCGRSCCQEEIYLLEVSQQPQQRVASKAAEPSVRTSFLESSLRIGINNF